MREKGEREELERQKKWERERNKVPECYTGWVSGLERKVEEGE